VDTAAGGDELEDTAELLLQTVAKPVNHDAVVNQWSTAVLESPNLSARCIPSFSDWEVSELSPQTDVLQSFTGGRVAAAAKTDSKAGPRTRFILRESGLRRCLGR
jgi:hypothetical protein